MTIKGIFMFQIHLFLYSETDFLNFYSTLIVSQFFLIAVFTKK